MDIHIVSNTHTMYIHHKTTTTDFASYAYNGVTQGMELNTQSFQPNLRYTKCQYERDAATGGWILVLVLEISIGIDGMDCADRDYYTGMVQSS